MDGRWVALGASVAPRVPMCYVCATREAGATGAAGGGQGREDPRVSLIKFRC